MLRLVSGWATLALVMTGCTPPRTGLNQGDRLPGEFSMIELARACLPSGLHASDEDPAHDTAVLAWSKALYHRDDGPALEVWECLVWQQCTDVSGNQSWILKTLFRHPQYENEWTYASLGHHTQEGLRKYATPPTLDEAIDFVHAAWWDPDLTGFDEDEPPDVVLGSAFCARAWERTIGPRPSLPLAPEDPAVRAERRKPWGDF